MQHLCEGLRRSWGHSLHNIKDTYFYIFTSKEEWTARVHIIEQCTDALYNWPSHNSLVFNPSKSEVIHFNCVQAQCIKDFGNINIAGTSITLSPSIKSLGVILDSHLTFDDHVAAVSYACDFHIRALQHIRASLPDDVAKMVACRISCSRLDYCNSLLVGMSDQLLKTSKLGPEYPGSHHNGRKLYDHVQKEVIHITPCIAKLH